MTNASVSPSVAPKTSVDEIPWNKHMSQQRSISDWIAEIYTLSLHDALPI